MAVTYVGKGAAVTGSTEVPPAPELPAGLAVHDLLLALFYSLETTDATVGISEGWREHYNERTNGGLLALWSRFVQPGDAAPTFTLGTEFLFGQSVAQIAAWRNVALADPNRGSLVTVGEIADLGPIPAITFPANSLMLILGGKLDDIGHASAPSPGDVAWVNIDAVSPVGFPGSFEWYYKVNGGSPVTPADQTMIFSNVPAARGKGAMLAFDAGSGFHPALASNYRRMR